MISKGGHYSHRYECDECGHTGLWYPLQEDAEIDEELHMHKVHRGGEV